MLELERLIRALHRLVVVAPGPGGGGASGRIVAQRPPGYLVRTPRRSETVLARRHYVLELIQVVGQGYLTLGRASPYRAPRRLKS